MSDSGKRKQVWLSSEQIGAIRLSVETGREIARDYPGIAADYMAGMFLGEIAEHYGFMSRYGVTERIAANAVQYALRELIPEDELRELGAAHVSASSRDNGLRSLADGTGVFSLTPDQRSAAGRKGGRMGGEKARDEGLGIHAMTPDQRAKAGRRGGRKGGRVVGPMLLREGRGIHAQSPEERRAASRKGVRAKGQVPWSDDERDCFFELCQDPGYQHRKGCHKGRPDYVRIAAELSSRFGTDRSPQSLYNTSSRRKPGAGEA
jgi:hypothetical protein